MWLLAFLALLAGLALARLGHRPVPALCWAGICLLPWAIYRRTCIGIIIVVVCGLSLGWWRGADYVAKLANYQRLYYHKVTLVAVAQNDGVYGTHSQLSFDGANIRTDKNQTLAGKVQISGFGLNSVLQGDSIEATGKLYPAQGTYQARLSFAQLQIIAHHPSVVAEVRRRFAAGMQSALPEPLASFAMGLLIGQRATLPTYVKQDLLMVGLTHIIAVSGYNLTIILQASRGLLAARSKRGSFMLTVGLTAGFLLLAGSSASIVRAAIVSMLSIGATYYGRSFKPLNLILLAAALTAFKNPFYIWNDLSWYLSFLAFFGVMVLAPAILAGFRSRLRESLIVQIALESICAELMTLPIIIHTFGQVSFISLVANVLVVALIPVAMLCSTVAGLAGMFAGSVAGWLSWPARLLLTYMLDTAHLLAHLPHIFIQNLSLSLTQMLVLYAALITFMSSLGFKNKSKSALITDKTIRNF